MNDFVKYNSRVKKFIERINIKNNKILDENDNDLTPYNKIIKPVEKDELLFFQNNVVPNITINNVKFGKVATESIKAIAGGSYSIILYVNDSTNNKLIIKIQEHSKLSDVDAYLKITNNLQREFSQYLIKMYGVFKSFNKFESFDDNVGYEPTVDFKKDLLNVYIVFENADGNIRELTKYLFNLKTQNYDKWILILKTFLYSMISAIIFLHNAYEQHAMLHLDLRPENIVYLKNKEDLGFKLIDIGSVVEYEYDKETKKERLRGSGNYSKYIYKNSPYRDYYNLWLTICEVFDIYDFKAYNVESRENIRELISNCHKQTEILSKDKPNFLYDLFDSKHEKQLITNLSNLKNSINVFRLNEKLNFNISKADLLKYTDKFSFQ